MFAFRRDRTTGAFQLGRKTCHVTQQVGTAKYVHFNTGAKRLTVVQRFDFTDGLRMFFNEVSQVQQYSLPLVGLHIGPWTTL